MPVDDTADEPGPVERRTFEQDLCDIINRHSMENHSDTPDFILCEFLRKSLETFDVAVRLRERWYGREGELTVALGARAPK
jgi:hypothetical protein